MDHFFTAILAYSDSLLKFWLKQSLMQHLALQNSCWMILSLFDSLIKNLFALATMKNSHNNQLYSSVATKKKQVGAKRYLHTRMTFSHSLMVLCRCQNLTKAVWYCLILDSKSMKSVIVACFCYNSCCLSYARSLASLETVLHCIQVTLVFWH